MKKIILLATLSVACASSAQENPAPAANACTASALEMLAPLDLGPKQALTIKTVNGSHDFMVDIADEGPEQIRGLMFREDLANNEGMLFEFDRPKVSSIWMKNTLIPLDILFVRENGKILKIAHNAVPCSLRSASSEAVVGAVLEIPGGRAKDLGIVPGDTVIHEYFNNTETDSDK